MTKKVAIVGLFLESNRYADVVAAQQFKVMRREQITDDARSASPILLKEGQGFFEQMDSNGPWCPIPISIMLGGAGGPAEHSFIINEILNIEREISAESSLDGVYILNHGAMTTTDEEDPDGLLYRAIRRAVGPDVPVVATVDLHANISQRMVDHADVIVAYRTDPHVDQFDRGREAANIMSEIWAGMRPVVSNLRLPLVPPNVSLLTAHGPYADLINFGQSQLDRDILNISIVAGFAFSDTSENGLHIIVTARQTELRAERLCHQIARMAWSMRARFMWNLMPIADAVNRAQQTGAQPNLPALLLADLGDNVGAGGPGNTLWLLEALHKAKTEGVVIGSFFDPTLAAMAVDAGAGSRIDARFHGDNWEGAAPVYSVNAALVQATHPGIFYISTGPLSGMRVNAGPIGLLDLDGLKVLVTSRRPIVWPDPTLLSALGVDVRLIRTLVLKCRSNYRAVFDQYFTADQMVEVDTPGRTSPVLTRHQWQRLPRPSYPLDLDCEWLDEPDGSDPDPD
jgi:microcystin degradation protein MlrC